MLQSFVRPVASSVHILDIRGAYNEHLQYNKKSHYFGNLCHDVANHFLTVCDGCILQLWNMGASRDAQLGISGGSHIPELEDAAITDGKKMISNIMA